MNGLLLFQQQAVFHSIHRQYILQLDSTFFHVDTRNCCLLPSTLYIAHQTGKTKVNDKV